MTIARSGSSDGLGPHHRHPIHQHQQYQNQRIEPTSEGSPLVVPSGDNNDDDNSVLQPTSTTKDASWVRHFSMMEENVAHSLRQYGHSKVLKQRSVLFGIFVFVLFTAALLVNQKSGLTYVPVEDAEEHWIDIDTEKGLQIWFRTWGNRNGIPIVFIHGGPGNAIADYFNNGNKRFFQDDDHSYFVVEIDQRGTGNSQPSVRDSWKNMIHYSDITIDKMCADFEIVRQYLGIEKWLVWGGSFGSTLGINYGQRYPERCLALILRGIYLDTAEEVSAVYSRDTYIDNPKRLREFDIFYDYIAKMVEPSEKELDPNDAESLMRVYADAITSGNRLAMWHWFVFENNLMELDPRYILDPDRIDREFLPEAMSVAFFETRLWLHGSYDHPTSDLLNEKKMKRLQMPIWICQGQRDEVCPPQYARRFANLLEEQQSSPWIVSRFVNGTHEDSDPVIEQCLHSSLDEFLQLTTNHKQPGFLH